MRVSVGSAVTEGPGPQVGVKVGASAVAVGGIGVSVGSAVTEGPGPQQVAVNVKSSITIVRHLISFLSALSLPPTPSLSQDLGEGGGE